jgi:hypothetical protein
MFGVLCLLALIEILAAAPSAQPSELCDIAARLQASKADFKEFRGQQTAQFGGDGTWHTPLELKGADCEISTVLSKGTWTCYFHFDGSQEGEARAKYTQLDQQLNRCFKGLRRDESAWSAIYIGSQSPTLILALTLSQDFKSTSPAWELSIAATLERIVGGGN